MQGQMWNGTGQEIPPAITSPEDGSIFDMGTTTVGTELTYQILIKGEGLTTRLTTSMSDNEYFYVSANSFSASEANSGTMFTVTFTADDLGTFNDTINISSDEVSTTFVLIATATDPGDDPGPGPEPVLGDSITEDWEGCITGGYWTDMVEGNAFEWEFINAGIWGDNLCHGELSCRMGKTNSSVISMAEDVEGDICAMSFWATCFGSDADANLRVDYSTDQGASWNELGDFTFTRGRLQYVLMDIPVSGKVRFRIVQTSGARVNIDDITIYARAQGLLGDVNGDGEVNIADINAIIDAILDDGYASPCDVNTDSEVNIADVNAVIDIILTH
jgi:hypothetical protein